MNRQEAIEGINDKLKDLKYYAKEMGEVLKSTNYFIDELERQAKKEERPKPKAYHVKDEYSYNELMKELEEQGYTSLIGIKATNLEFWENYKQKTVIYCDEDKNIRYSHLSHYETEEKDNYDLIEYHKEEPKFYAKIKGTQVDIRGVDGLRQEFTMRGWNKLGINDSNAEFEKVEDVVEIN